MDKVPGTLGSMSRVRGGSGERVGEGEGERLLSGTNNQHKQLRQRERGREGENLSGIYPPSISLH